MRAILLGLMLLGAGLLVAPVADACVPPNCPGFGGCHLTTETLYLSTGDEVRVPTGVECYY